MNNNLIFLHLPKNGGTTFHSILNRLYSKDSTFTIESVTNSETNERVFVNMPAHDRAKINLVKGHTLFGLHEYMNENTKYITFLRKPADRIPSFYYYVLRKPNNKLYKTITDNKMTLYDFVTQVESIDLNNCQVRWISGIDDKEELMLEKALENIEKHFSFVGITEKYNECLILLQNLYHWSTPYYMVKNKTINRPMVDKIDDKTIAAINHYNNADNQLYEIMAKRITQLIENTEYMYLNLAKLALFNKIYSNEFGRKIAGNIKRKLM
ncbi:sulfotransferase family 2 domain-containing protein [Aequorivita aquimaris]|nr:sulfotransferase family 2 domain-containing protein [Aequorivita aquimaris]